MTSHIMTPSSSSISTERHHNKAIRRNSIVPNNKETLGAQQACIHDYNENLKLQDYRYHLHRQAISSNSEETLKAQQDCMEQLKDSWVVQDHRYHPHRQAVAPNDDEILKAQRECMETYSDIMDQPQEPVGETCQRQALEDNIADSAIEPREA